MADQADVPSEPRAPESDHRTGVQWILLLDGLLALSLAWAWNGAHPTVLYSVAGGGVALVVWQAALWWLHLARGRPLAAVPRIRLPHWFQTFTQGSHFVYWGLYYAPVFEQAPLIFIQIVFGYSLEALLCWSRKRTWSVGFGPLPVVGSINLFMWFKPEFFYGQLLMVALAFFAKEFVRWKRGDKVTHIFNPSAIALTAVGLTLIVCGSLDQISGVNLIISYEYPPNFFEFMFLFGLAVQLLFHTTQVTLGAAVALTLVHYGLAGAFGQPLTTQIFHINVFLGLNLLATDPTTSPRSKTGKLVFGFTWGLAIAAFQVGLLALGEPGYFDKIFPVPLLNLLVPQFERLAAKIDAALEGWAPNKVLQSRFVHMGAYVVLFVAILPNLKRPPDIPVLADRLAHGTDYRTAETHFLIANDEFFRAFHPDAGAPFGFLAEIREYPNYAGRMFADSWRTAGGVLEVTVRSGVVTGVFVATGERFTGEVVAHGTQIQATWTELPQALIPPPGESLHTYAHRDNPHLTVPPWLRIGTLDVSHRLVGPNTLTLRLTDRYPKRAPSPPR